MCWGDNTYGQLGDNTTENKLTPTYVYGNYNFSSIKLGSNHICSLLQNGSAMCWGDNTNGQLGDNTTTERHIPILVYGNYNFSTIKLGTSFSCGLLQNGTALCWGNNGVGKLGDNTIIQKEIPTPVYGNYSFLNLYLGATHSCGLLQNGTALCWGANAVGQLGDNTTTEKHIPTPVYGNYNFSIIDLGIAYTCGLLQNGTVLCWGYNIYGQLGDGTEVNKYIPNLVKINELFNSINIGGTFIFGVLTDGRVVSWGYNVYGQQAFSNFNSKIPTKNIYKGRLIGKNANSFDIGFTFEGNSNVLVNNGFRGIDLDSEYNNIVLSYKDREAKIYVNGELSETFNPPGFTLSTALENIILGKNYNGDIDDLMMWNRSLSDSEIEFIYKSNLEKLNETSWSFTTSFSDLAEATYRYGVFVQDGFGWVRSLRNLIVDFPEASTGGSTGGSTNLIFTNGVVNRGFPKGHVLKLGERELKIGEFDSSKVSLSFDSSEVIVELGKSEKIDIDQDGFYDYEIGYSGSTGNFADLVITEIYEKVPAVQEEAKVEDGDLGLGVGDLDEEKKGFFRRIWDWFVGLFG